MKLDVNYCHLECPHIEIHDQRYEFPVKKRAKCNYCNSELKHDGHSFVSFDICHIMQLMLYRVKRFKGEIIGHNYI